MLILSDKLLLDIQLFHTFMPNMIHKPWMVSTEQVSKRQNMQFASFKKQNSLVLKIKKWNITSKLALGLLNAYKLNQFSWCMYFHEDIHENKDGKILEGNEWVLCNRRWILHTACISWPVTMLKGYIASCNSWSSDSIDCTSN